MLSAKRTKDRGRTDVQTETEVEAFIFVRRLMDFETVYNRL